MVDGKQLTGTQRWATGVTTEGVERGGVLRGGGSATEDLNVKSNGVWWEKGKNGGGKCTRGLRRSHCYLLLRY